MKKFIIAIMIFISIQSNAQNVITTEEEYNYLTKGYPEGIKKGLDIKSNYKLSKINEETFSRCTVTLYSFTELSSDKTKAYLIERKNSDKPLKTRYYCLPINNKELFRLYHIETSNEPLMQAYAVCLTKLLIDNLQNNPAGKL